MSSYNAEIRVRAKVDNSEVVKLEASMESAERKAEDLEKAVDKIGMDKAVTEDVEQAGVGMEELAQKTQKTEAAAQRMAERLAQARAEAQAAAEAANRLDEAFKNTKIHTADGRTLDWNLNEITDAATATEELQQEQESLADKCHRSAEAMQQLAEETRKVNEQTYGSDAVSRWDEMSREANRYLAIMEELDSQGVSHDSEEFRAAHDMWKQAQENLNEYRKEIQNTSAEVQQLEETGPSGDALEQALTPTQNMLKLIRQSFQDLPAIFGIVKDKFFTNSSEMESQWDNLSNRAAAYKQILKELESQDIGFGDAEYDAAYIQWQQAEQAIKEYKASLLGAKEEQTDLSLDMQRISRSVKNMFRKMTVGANGFFSSARRGGQSTNSIFKTLSSRLKGIALSLLVFNWITKGFNAMVSGMKTGFENLMGYSDDYANSVQELKNAMTTLGNSFAAAFAPIVQAAIPYLVQLINWINSAVNAVAQLIAALSGKSTWTKATKVQAGYNDELKDTASSAKKAYGALAKFDDLDVLQKQDNTGTSGSTSGADGGFEEVPIADGILDFAEKLKKIFSELFKPLKAAWDQEGQFVMDSWKYALNEIGNLAKDIGRDFLTVWNQDKTIQMLADILHIIGDIGLVIGNVAHALDEAWNKNNTGLHILENIRDIFAAIVSNIRQAADYTVEWSAKLNFTPLFESIERLTASLVPFADFVSGTLADFYTNFILPLTSWTLSDEGLPRLLNLLSDFVEEIDWETLRASLKDLYTALEPYAEAVAEGLIDFLSEVKTMGVDFINSLPAPISALTDALSSGKPEEIRGFSKSLLELATAFAAFKAIFTGVEKLSASITSLIISIKSIGPGISSTLSYLSPGAIGLAGMTITDMFKGTILDPFEWDNAIGELLRFVTDAWARFWDGVIEVMSHPVQTLLDAFKSVFNWDETSEIFKEAGESFEKAFDGENIGSNIVEGLFKGIEGAILFLLEPINDLFRNIIDGVKELFGIQSPSTVFQEIGEYLIEGLSLGIQEKWESILEFFSIAGENLKLFFFDTWTSIKENASEIWESVKQFFVDTWTLIQEKALEIWEHLRTTFDQKMDAIKDKTQKISDKFNEFKTTVSTVFTSVKESIVGAIEKIIGKISDFISKIQEAIQAVKDFLSSGFEKISGFFGGIFGGSGSSGISATAYSANAASYSLNDVPALASGAVIRGGNPFLAMLGDQPAGQTNVEAPLSTIEQAVENVMSRNGYGLGGAARIVLQLNGQDVGEALVDDLLSVMNRRGLDVEVLGVT